jgi:tetratricopeptide (TPR) repeat protein
MKAFERAAHLSEKTYGPDHAEAQKVLRRSLEIHRKASGIDSHAATEDLFHLAASLEESGDIEGATAEYERVLAVKERQIGGDLMQTAETQAHLAAIYMRAGRTSAAQSVAIRTAPAPELAAGPAKQFPKYY